MKSSAEENRYRMLEPKYTRLLVNLVALFFFFLMFQHSFAQYWYSAFRSQAKQVRRNECITNF